MCVCVVCVSPPVTQGSDLKQKEPVGQNRSSVGLTWDNSVIAHSYFLVLSLDLDSTKNQIHGTPVQRS